MKSRMNRTFPIILDVQEQLDQKPNTKYIFLYDDDTAFRAFICDNIIVHPNSHVEALLDGRIAVAIPFDTNWRLVHVSNIHLVTGHDMVESELRSDKERTDIYNKLVKELELEKKSLTTEYTEKGYNPKLYP